MGLEGVDTSRSVPDTELRAAIRERIRMVREQLRENKPLETRNKRRNVRRPFRYPQRIAPYESVMPDESRFFQVMCCDISTSGFSFQAQAVPGFKQLIVELGIVPNAIYLIARIVRIQQEAATVFVVGCEFTGRAMELSTGK